ncbi:unnamed protein product [Lactuca virosa]|uniref:Uncharacterized protein n=1 Tax=Lactuca virosa TaxID=75947 RepID=A0AAU9N4Z7_9ASTR|nr:unnamed protein product [Lactuca virosa]
MESAKPSSSAPPYSGGRAGAGGKFRKPPISRKRASTPYDRPSLTTGNNKSDEPQDGGGSWLSKLVVNPARRLIVGGATRILPSFFSKSDSSSADEYENDPPGDRDDQHIDATENAKSDAKHTLELGVSSNERDKLKGSSEHNILQQDESKNSPSNHGLAKIENMLKGKQFSRDERNRLMEILNSRLVDVSNTEEEKKTPEVISLSHGKAKENVVEIPMPHLQSNVKDEVGASPIDIARAYMMGNRTSEKLGFNTYTIKSKDERESQNHDLIPSKLHNISPSSKSPTCWPGVMVQEQRGYLTPQIQRTRYGLHGFPRTPYSRTIYSTTKPKVNQIQSDNKPYNVSVTPFQHSRTPIFGQMKSSGDVYGSVGPIRRVRNKFPFEPQSERRSSASRSFVPDFQKNLEASGSSITSGASSETVRKIMEQLDRHKPTPKEKADELKLATEWKKSSSENNSNLIIPNSKESSILGSFVKRNDDGVDPVKTLHKDAEPSFGFKNTSAADDEEKGKSQPWSFDSQINGQDASKKRQSQPMLKPISFKRPDPQQVISSSDNSRGFTFPFSVTASSASEPPTPSIMPSFPATGVAPPVIPSYSFGTKKSERVVFSFPSTSSGVIPIGDGESDLKFNFGSDKKRVSFGSIGTDAIAIN